MASLRQVSMQRFVYKIDSSRLRRSRWNLKLSLEEARENKELIGLNESQLIRFIDDINNEQDCTDKIIHCKHVIKRLKRETVTEVEDFIRVRNELSSLYKKLDKYQFKKDYVCVVIDKVDDYRKMYKHGFKINNVSYRRLLGTTGGVKNSVIVFVSENMVDELKRRIANGRNLNKEFTPAKLEAYQALTCSASIPVSTPNGICVVHDCITSFKADVIKLDDTDCDEPAMEYIENYDIELNNSDGYGMGMPELMEQWGNDLEKGYRLSGCVIRNSFCKGLVVCVDFQKFCRNHNIKYIVDVWGERHNVSEIQLVLTESMLKLWDSYSSIHNYMRNCEENGYTFSVTKAAEHELENERTMNYQFLQSYDFTEDQLDQLVAPTVKSIKESMSEDYRKMILYTKGMELNENNVKHLDNSCFTGLMIEPELQKDPYVKRTIRGMINKRIKDAKVGVLSVPANYSLICGDPYSLCQSMCGLEVTGLLKSGQVYSQYWNNKGIKKIASFRAPMTSHNNIRPLEIADSKEMRDFYQYLVTITVFNSWDTCADAMNGFDYDGDAVINTSMDVIVDNTILLPAIVCIQRKSPKCIPTEEDLMESNIKSFGNTVGSTTNKITGFFETLAGFKKGTREYDVIDYRIKCGQLFQQNSIDRTKGIESKSMPAKWYSLRANKQEEDATQEEMDEFLFNRSVVSDKKPYFMKYIYPHVKKEYDDYIKNKDRKCVMRFGMSFEELQSKSERTDEEQTFIDYYYKKLPLGMNACTINRICWKIESIFDDSKEKACKDDIDISLLKSTGEYDRKTAKKIEKIYAKYSKSMKEYVKVANTERVKADEKNLMLFLIKRNFKMQCKNACNDDQELCNIVIDLFYNTITGRQFAWDICGDTIINNLLEKRNYTVSFPTKDENGDIEFNGEKFSMKTVNLEKSPEIAMEG